MNVMENLVFIIFYNISNTVDSETHLQIVKEKNNEKTHPNKQMYRYFPSK